MVEKQRKDEERTNGNMTETEETARKQQMKRERDGTIA